MQTKNWCHVGIPILVTLLTYRIAEPTTVADSPPSESPATHAFLYGQQDRVKASLWKCSLPKTKDRRSAGDLRYPAKYDYRAQAVVYLAIQQLFTEGSATFDALVEHFDDKRYSYTYEAGTGQFNRSVGQVCHDIMYRNLACWDFEVDLLTV